MLARATDDDIPSIRRRIQLHRTSVPATSMAITLQLPEHLSAIGLMRAAGNRTAIDALQPGAPGHLMGIPQDVVAVAVVGVVPALTASGRFALADHQIVGQRRARGDAMSCVLDIAAIDQHALRILNRDTVAVAITAVVLGMFERTLANRDPRRMIQLHPVTRKIDGLNIVDPAIAHTLEIHRGPGGAAVGAIVIVGKLDAEPGDTHIALHAYP